MVLIVPLALWQNKADSTGIIAMHKVLHGKREL
jgi:hypothetical protein